MNPANNASEASVDWTDQTEFTENLLAGPFSVNMEGWLNEDEFGEQGRTNGGGQSLGTFTIDNLYGSSEGDAMSSTPSTSSTKSSYQPLQPPSLPSDPSDTEQDVQNAKRDQQEQRLSTDGPSIDSNKSSNQASPRKKQHTEDVTPQITQPSHNVIDTGQRAATSGSRSNISKAFLAIQAGKTAATNMNVSPRGNSSVYNATASGGGQCVEMGAPGAGQANMGSGETEANSLSALAAQILSPSDFAVTDSGCANNAFANSNATSGSTSLKSCSFDENDSVDGDFSSEGDSDFGGSGGEREMDFDSASQKDINDDDGGEHDGERVAGGDGGEHYEGEGSKRRRESQRKTEVSVKAKNREHAKNTRMRKKNFIESLKESVKLLSDERDKVDRDRRISLSRLAEQTNVRKQVLQTMFFFRATAETSVSRWSTILDDSFQLVLPITPYRSFPPFEIVNAQRRAAGIDAMIADTSSLAVMVQSIGTAQDDGDQVRVQYYSGPEDTIMTGDSFMCKWLLRTENAVRRGARYEVFKQGMLKATFSPQNKLTYLELIFDVMSFMQQLRRASGKNDFMVVPNTLSIAKEESPEARLILEASPPYRVDYVSQSWCELFGYEPSKVVGEGLRSMQGMDMEGEKISILIASARIGRPLSCFMTSYTQDGDKFKNFVRLYPLYTNTDITHYLAVMEAVQDTGMMMTAPFAARAMAESSVSSGSTNASGSSMRSGSSSSYRNGGSNSPSTVSSASSNVSSSNSSGVTDSSGIAVRGGGGSNGVVMGGAPLVNQGMGHFTGGRIPSVSSMSSLGQGMMNHGISHMPMPGGMMNPNYGVMGGTNGIPRQGIPTNMSLPQYQQIMTGAGAGASPGVRMNAAIPPGAAYGMMGHFAPPGYMVGPSNGMMPMPMTYGMQMQQQQSPLPSIPYMTAAPLQGPGAGLNPGNPMPMQLPPIPAIHADSIQYIPRAPIPQQPSPYDHHHQNLGISGLTGNQRIGGGMMPDSHLGINQLGRQLPGGAGGMAGLVDMSIVKEERISISDRVPEWCRSDTGMDAHSSSKAGIMLLPRATDTSSVSGGGRVDRSSSSSSSVGSRTPMSSAGPMSGAESAPAAAGGATTQSPRARGGKQGKSRSPRHSSGNAGDPGSSGGGQGRTGHSSSSGGGGPGPGQSGGSNATHHRVRKH